MFHAGDGVEVDDAHTFDYMMDHGVLRDPFRPRYHDKADIPIACNEDIVKVMDHTYFCTQMQGVARYAIAHGKGAFDEHGLNRHVRTRGASSKHAFYADVDSIDPRIKSALMEWDMCIQQNQIARQKFNMMLGTGKVDDDCIVHEMHWWYISTVLDAEARGIRDGVMFPFVCMDANYVSKMEFDLVIKAGGVCCMDWITSYNAQSIRITDVTMCGLRNSALFSAICKHVPVTDPINKSAGSVSKRHKTTTVTSGGHSSIESGKRKHIQVDRGTGQATPSVSTRRRLGHNARVTRAKVDSHK